MKRSQAILGGLVLVMTMATQPSYAQAPPVLIYSQALSPAATVLIQEKLQQAGVYAGRADGIWGPDSQAALERFQQTRSLQVTGQLNQATVATLGVTPGDLLVARPAQPPAAASSGAAVPDLLSSAAVRNVQQRLRSLGFYRGATDGLWGAGTQTAIERFQQGRGLQATGQVNPATLQALGLDPNDPAAPRRLQ
ncbi:peptidoglycan-binding domain-containing protein [Neoroseomonas oryzicola]|uniref:Peptidoglycan-binding protein n=1 Tax=Neoroseomonas oryzicola TaxID=535904 RepID=A0A9X9WNN3_9PROT|nr:peptidoglycan-binding domain-containing protein [Neoroseomonas oryzicola]MBR0661943.1 peptidoglycan-binding protein [Neoroseomonas oryzicola]NKE20209.1 peptidoglycan-binding protein [Neoroseomonas oryzicola]